MYVNYQFYILKPSNKDSLIIFSTRYFFHYFLLHHNKYYEIKHIKMLFHFVACFLVSG